MAETIVFGTWNRAKSSDPCASIKPWVDGFIPDYFAFVFRYLCGTNRTFTCPIANAAGAEDEAQGT